MAVIAQMKLLIGLSQADGVVAQSEKTLIHNIGKANGLTEEEVDELLGQRHPMLIPDDLPEELKFEFVFNLARLMVIDEKMYREEILFCSQVASSLGYDKQVMFDLMLRVKSTVMDPDEIANLRALTRQYLK